jgi:hypothetical protein
MNPRLAASLTAIVGLSMLAGWLSAFRNRAYLGWLGLAFMSVSGYLLAYDRGQSAKAFNLPVGGAILAQKVFLAAALAAFLLSLVAAARETMRRIREIQEGHRAAEEALLEMLRASAEKDRAAGSDGRTDEPPQSGDKS